MPTTRKPTNFGLTSGFMHVLCEAIARPPCYSRGHQRTLRTSALPGLGYHYIRSSSVAFCPP